VSTAAWFRPKRFGYGAVPVTWQGWLLTFVSAAVIAGCVTVSILANMRHWPHDGVLTALCAGLGVLAIVVLTIVARATTVGDWKWRP
jgi:hypothetical protein